MHKVSTILFFIISTGYSEVWIILLMQKADSYDFYKLVSKNHKLRMRTFTILRQRTIISDATPPGKVSEKKIHAEYVKEVTNEESENLEFGDRQFVFFDMEGNEGERCTAKAYDPHFKLFEGDNQIFAHSCSS